mmetsp:Transcript_36885/g.147326  ORF Transcript_36885/g.147326 Transcript_36885/m.147326 type:complete len:86 (-) Transcript_36885:91-348(-)
MAEVSSEAADFVDEFDDIAQRVDDSDALSKLAESDAPYPRRGRKFSCAPLFLFAFVSQRGVQGGLGEACFCGTLRGNGRGFIRSR